MKTRFTLLGIVAMLVVSICAIFVSCNKELNDIINYSGQVVYLKTTTPFPNLAVKVTDGTNIHCQGFTDEGGFFTLKVKVNEIDGNYYLLAGDSTCVPKKVGLGGYGQTEVDLGVIEVEGPSLPVVITHAISSVTADAAVCGGEVTSAGRLKITARGVCYGTDVYPEVSGSHTKDGEGVGAFTSTLKDLAHNTIYYARAYATNSMGTAYGEQIAFTTESGIPTVQTNLVRVDGKTMVYYEGSVTDAGDSPVTARGICWGSSTPTIANQKTTDGDGLGGYSGNLTVSNVHSQDLYIRAYATNGSGTAYGEAIKIDHRNPYNLPIVEGQHVKYIVLPYDLQPGYMNYKDLNDTGNTAYMSCVNLVAYDYDDWELPSMNVLWLIYDHQEEIGGFTGGEYWSNERAETSSSRTEYWYLDFSKGTGYTGYGLKSVRPVREY